MADETLHVRPGNDAVVSRLCDIVVIQAIRHWIERDPAAQTGWLGALHDQQIGTTIARIHGDPAADWTVAALADQVAMSRSAFAARFTQLVGESAAFLGRRRGHGVERTGTEMLVLDGAAPGRDEGAVARRDGPLVESSGQGAIVESYSAPPWTAATPFPLSGTATCTVPEQVSPATSVAV